jgi:cell division protein FtsL
VLPSQSVLAKEIWLLSIYVIFIVSVLIFSPPVNIILAIITVFKFQNDTDKLHWSICSDQYSLTAAEEQFGTFSGG